MEPITAFGFTIGIIFLIFLAILSFFAPYFLWRIHRNIKAIREMMERSLASKGSSEESKKEPPQ